MADPIVCLQCGGFVDEGQPSGEELCQCPPASIQAFSLHCPDCGGALRVGARSCPYCNSTVASKRCERCVAWNLAEARHCQKCGHELGAGISGEGGVLDQVESCPRCTGPLRARQYLELEAEECDACGGMFLRQSMINKIVETRDKAQVLRLALPSRIAKREEQVHYLHCPRCNVLMNRSVFGRVSGVIVDMCKEHGVWFDAGELSEILSFVELGGLGKMRERELLDLKEQTRALKAEQTKLNSASMGQVGGSGPHSLWKLGHRGGLAEFVEGLIEVWTEIR